jgi:segregation and condensation protein B
VSRRPRPSEPLDRELADLPPNLRWREWMGRVEAVIFASPEPVGREILTRVVGRDCSLDLIIDDIREELRGRPYELVAVASGWQHRTKKGFAPAIRAATGLDEEVRPLSKTESLVLTAIAYLQPVTRRDIGHLIGKEVSRDTIGYLRSLGFVVAGPRSPEPGAPYSYVTTKAFLSEFGFETLRDLPDLEMLEEAGLLSKEKALVDDFPVAAGDRLEDDDGDDDEIDLLVVEPDPEVDRE